MQSLEIPVPIGSCLDTFQLDDPMYERYDNEDSNGSDSDDSIIDKSYFYRYISSIL